MDLQLTNHYSYISDPKWLEFKLIIYFICANLGCVPNYKAKRKLLQNHLENAKQIKR